MNVTVSGNIIIPGTEPIVIIGPNGSGKTRHAITMVSMNNANMIAALRNIALPPNVVMRSMDQAKNELNNHLNRRRSQPWELSNEINELFSKLMAEDSASAIDFRNRHAEDPSVSPEITKLMRLSDAWARLFPGRHIDFSGYHPRVRSDYNISGSEYPAQQMSDGERVALYLTGRVLDSEQKIIIVDEPEVHFHSRLASRFWSELESLRPDCRFVYITHDLPFALSRRNAHFVIIRPNNEPQLVCLKEGIPDDLAESLLAAASFSIHARRIVFCEGTEGNSLDQRLYSAWFSSPETAVVPAGSGKDVVKCTSTFSESTLVFGVDAIGIIDRDYWPQKFIDALPESVSVLSVHEVENLVCVRNVFLCIAKHLGKKSEESEAAYSSFLDKAKRKFDQGLFNKQVSERFKRRCEHEFNMVLNSLNIAADINDVCTQHINAIEPSTWGVTPAAIFNEEKLALESALADNEKDFMAFFPGKVFLRDAAQQLGMTSDSYIDLVCNSLIAAEDDPLSELGALIEQELSAHLPLRNL
ncbi:hypothetical protein GF1_17040 [Desulfolithobacter dissulfuricans]|uniref:Uncharacterized protein n=1 Tax=Desulfolithobacter dissulfuricans TaxID=2795293 RepID=A0A915XKJ7_9BACT|nr:AAA family ATPase [Desulfolithobacter dissulfuricans]BCO09328.1 hypothetical protein GF1_17040 [Desulfolithobacter dissulfuricans]